MDEPRFDPLDYVSVFNRRKWWFIVPVVLSIIVAIVLVWTLPRSYRLDRMRKATMTKTSFTPREGFDPQGLSGATTARIWYSPAVARWEIEKGATPLADGAALADKSVGSAEWLVGEVVSYRGEAVVLEPHELRAQVAIRARQLAIELRPSRTKA